MAPDVSQRRHKRPAVFKKLLVSGTEIIQALFTFCSSEDAIFRAAAVAHIQNRAVVALPRQRLLFSPPKSLLAGAVEQHAKRCLANVAQSMLRHREMVAAINISVALQNRHIASLAKNAERMLQSKGGARSFFKDLDFDAANIAVQPGIKYRT